MEPFVTVTFNDLSPAQARNLFASLRCDYQGPQPVVEPAVAPPSHPAPAAASAVAEPTTTAVEATTAPAEAPKKPRGRPRKEKPADATPPGGDLPLAEPEPSKQPTLNDARTAMAELSSKKGLDECRKLLTKFGANRIGELNVAKYAEFIKACAA